MIAFTTTPIAATTIIVIASTGPGSNIRPTASQAMPPSAKSRTMALVKDAMMVAFRKPYVLFPVAGFVASQLAPRQATD